MCGITGFWSQQPLPLSTLERMTRALASRGPDDEGYVVFDRKRNARALKGRDTIPSLSGLPSIQKVAPSQIGLGFRRLSIIDCSPAGHQPMTDSSKRYWIVFNGEIYNFAKLKVQLEKKGYRFRSHSDTEVLLNAYVAWGPACVRRLVGMFAFAIYDASKNRLFCARDRFGIKPFYYAASSGSFLFGSTITSILASDLHDARVCEPVLLDYLVTGMSESDAKRSFFEHIHKLPPAHYLLYDGKQLKTTPYWHLPKRVVRSVNADTIREQVSASVQDHFVSDVPVGACLSGGMDSSAIVSIGAKTLGKKFTTFSAVFDGEDIDESAFSQAVANDCRVPRIAFRPSVAGFQKDLDDLIRSQEEPFAGSSVYAPYCLAREAKKARIPVVLDGLGADETFLGYTYYIPFILKESLGDPVTFVQRFAGFARNYGLVPTTYYFLRHLLPVRLRIALEQRRSHWLKKSFIRRNIRRRDESTLQDMWNISFTNILPEYLRQSDRCSMRFSIEWRVPFVDHRVVKTGIQAPLDVLIDNGLLKSGLRDAMQGIVHETVRTRVKKIGFSTPENHWLRTPAFGSRLKDLFTSETFQNRPYWDGAACQKLLDTFLETGRHQADIWRLVNAELWLRQFIDPPAARRTGTSSTRS